MHVRPEIHIGGRIESAAPTHAVPAKDRIAIVSLLVLGLAIHGWLFAKTTVNARDGLSFTRLALQLESPKRIATPELQSPTIVDVLKKAEQPPGYPLAMLIISKIVRAASPITAEPGNHADAQLGEKMLLSGQIANCTAGVLLTIPMFLLGRLIGGRFVGVMGAAFFQVLPVAAHVTSDTLSEGCYLLGLTTSLWLGCRGLRRCGIGNFLAAGGVAGMTYLIRPEGLLVVIAIAAVTAWMGISRVWTSRQVLGCLTALGVGVALVAAPYMMMIGGLTNKPSGKGFMQETLGQERKPIWMNDKAGVGAIKGPELFAKWIDANTVGTAGRVAFAIGAVATETFKSAHYLPILFAGFGIFALRKRFRIDPAITLIGMLLFLNTGLLLAFATKIGYVSERHTLPLVMILCPLAAEGLLALAMVLSKWGMSSIIEPRRDRWLLALAVFVIALPSVLRPLHETRIGFKHAGQYLADVYQVGDIIIDPFSWAEFYAGPAVTRLIPEPDSSKVLYIVLDGPAGKSPHTRLPKMEMARNIAKAGKPVYHWPDDQPFENAQVVVYKTVR